MQSGLTQFQRTTVVGRVSLARQRGVTSIEYALLAALIAMAIIFGVAETGGMLGKLYEFVSTKVTC